MTHEQTAEGPTTRWQRFMCWLKYGHVWQQMPLDNKRCVRCGRYKVYA